MTARVAFFFHPLDCVPGRRRIFSLPLSARRAGGARGHHITFSFLHPLTIVPDVATFSSLSPPPLPPSLPAELVAHAGTDGGPLCRPPRLGAFFAFFSQAGLPPPLRGLRLSHRTAAPGGAANPEGVFFRLEASVDAAAGGPPTTLTIGAGPAGFALLPGGGRAPSAGAWQPTLVDLLRASSAVFKARRVTASP